MLFNEMIVVCVPPLIQLPSLNNCVVFVLCKQTSSAVTHTPSFWVRQVFYQDTVAFRGVGRKV